MKKIILALTLCTALAGCASATTGPIYNSQEIASISKNKAQIIVYIPHLPVAIIRNGPMLSLNGIEECKVTDGTFMVLNSLPGNTKLSLEHSMGSPDSGMELKTIAGHRYYIKVERNTQKTRNQQKGAVIGGLGGALGGALLSDDNIDNRDYLFKEIDKQTAQNDLIGEELSTSCR
jgi:hypothetical protein